MSHSSPPRYLPTLTEVVLPSAVPPELDTVTLMAEVVKMVTPMVEHELRATAHAQLDLQLNQLLPTLHPKIEAAVRQAMQQNPAPTLLHTHAVVSAAVQAPAVRFG